MLDYVMRSMDDPLQEVSDRHFTLRTFFLNQQCICQEDEGTAVVLSVSFILSNRIVTTFLLYIIISWTKCVSLPFIIVLMDFFFFFLKGFD